MNQALPVMGLTSALVTLRHWMMPSRGRSGFSATLLIRALPFLYPPRRGVVKPNY